MKDKGDTEIEGGAEGENDDELHREGEGSYGFR